MDCIRWEGLGRRGGSRITAGSIACFFHSGAFLFSLNTTRGTGFALGVSHDKPQAMREKPRACLHEISHNHCCHCAPVTQTGTRRSTLKLLLRHTSPVAVRSRVGRFPAQHRRQDQAGTLPLQRPTSALVDFPRRPAARTVRDEIRVRFLCSPSHKKSTSRVQLHGLVVMPPGIKKQR